MNYLTTEEITEYKTAIQKSPALPYAEKPAKDERIL